MGGVGGVGGMVGKELPPVMQAVSEFEARLEPPQIGDVLTLGIGYAAIMAFGALFGFLFLFFRLSRAYIFSRQNNHRNMSWREMCMLVPVVATRAYAYLAYSCVLLKVTFLLTIELGVFPLGFGVWVDLCSLPLFGACAVDRFHLGLKAPITFTLIHWSIGIV